MKERCFEEELTALMPRLKKYALRLTRRIEEAEDLLQQTLLIAWRKRDDFSEERPLAPWVASIMAYEHRQQCRVAARRSAMHLPDLQWGVDAPVAPVQDVRIQTREAILASQLLTDVLRETFVFVVIGEQGYGEVAARLGQKPRTIKQRMLRAREQLADFEPA